MNPNPCVRCAQKGLFSSPPLFFCSSCQTHFKTLVYIDGDRIGKYGEYCQAHYWNGERMMTTTFSIQTMKAFCSGSYTIPKNELPISRKKEPGYWTEAQFYRELYDLECEHRGFFAALAESQREEPLF